MPSRRSPPWRPPPGSPSEPIAAREHTVVATALKDPGFVRRYPSHGQSSTATDLRAPHRLRQPTRCSLEVLRDSTMQTSRVIGLAPSPGVGRNPAGRLGFGDGDIDHLAPFYEPLAAMGDSPHRTSGISGVAGQSRQSRLWTRSSLDASGPRHPERANTTCTSLTWRSRNAASQ